MNCGSGDSLNASLRCGLSANARQIRLIALWLIPVAAAIDRVDQCVALTGCSVVWRIVMASAFGFDVGTYSQGAVFALSAPAKKDDLKQFNDKSD